MTLTPCILTSKPTSTLIQHLTFNHYHRPQAGRTNAQNVWLRLAEATPPQCDHRDGGTDNQHTNISVSARPRLSRIVISHIRLSGAHRYRTNSRRRGRHGSIAYAKSALLMPVQTMHEGPCHSGCQFAFSIRGSIEGEAETREGGGRG